MIDTTPFSGWPNCVRISNNAIELIVTTDVGPRIVRAGFVDGRNFLYLMPEQLGLTGGDHWRIYGGHRLWHAPEAIPRSYHPDNSPVSWSVAGNCAQFIQETESSTGIQKELTIEMYADRNECLVTHRLTNHNPWNVELAAWALTVMQPGGRAIIPQEPFGEGDEFLLPARPLVLWSYTKMTDPRWNWGDKYITAQHDPRLTSEQKIGVLNKLGWMAYEFENERLTKYFSFKGEGHYADYGCNCEVYINDRFVELETLSPLTALEPGAYIDHVERWAFTKER